MENLQEKAIQIFLYRIAGVLEKEDLTLDIMKDNMFINLCILTLINKGCLIIKGDSFLILDVNKNIITKQLIVNSFNFIKKILETVGELTLFDEKENEESYFLKLNVDKITHEKIKP